MKADADVPRILRMDGVDSFCLDEANKEKISISDIIEKYGRDNSWSHTIINSKSNSATYMSVTWRG